MEDQPTTTEETFEQGTFYRQLGVSLVMWNSAEQTVRQLLAGLGRGSIHLGTDVRADILVAEMGSRQISDALRSFSHDVLEGDASELVNHAAAFFDRLLPYRNYYIHGITSVMGAPIVQREEFGQIQAVAAKGKLAFDQQIVEITKLQQFSRWAQELQGFVNGLMFLLIFPKEHQIPGKPMPSPEKPPLPDTLLKSRRTWRELTRPHQSSEG